MDFLAWIMVFSRSDLLFHMPVPDGPVFLVGPRGEFSARIHRVRMAHGAQKMPVQEAVSVSVAFTQIKPVLLGERFKCARLCSSVQSFAQNFAGPVAAPLFEVSGTDARVNPQSPG